MRTTQGQGTTPVLDNRSGSTDASAAPVTGSPVKSLEAPATSAAPAEPSKARSVLLATDHRAPLSGDGPRTVVGGGGSGLLRDALHRQVDVQVAQQAPSVTYTLGDAQQEQARLLRQRELYADTKGLRFAPSDHVCEFGCGVGANLWIAEQVESFVGLDVQPGQIAKATEIGQASGTSNARFMVASAEDTGLPSASFDVTFARLLLIHTANPQAILREMWRVTKPEGRLVSIEPHDASLRFGPNKPHLTKAFALRTQLAYGEGKGAPSIALDLPKLLESAGFTKVEARRHEVLGAWNEPDRLRSLYGNAWGLIMPLKDKLVPHLLSAEELAAAENEATSIVPGDTFSLTMMVTEAWRP